MSAPADGDLDAFRAEADTFLADAQSAGIACPAYGAILPPALHDRARAWQGHLAAAGFAGLHWPVEYGGRGLGRAGQAMLNAITAHVDEKTSASSDGGSR